MAWWKTAKPGDHVVYTGDGSSLLMTVGAIYTIREIFITDKAWSRSGEVGLRFEEVRGNFNCGTEYGWGPRNFRPVVLPKTLTDCLTSIKSPDLEAAQ